MDGEICICIYAYIHAYVHTYIHIYVHTHNKDSVTGALQVRTYVSVVVPARTTTLTEKMCGCAWLRLLVCFVSCLCTWYLLACARTRVHDSVAWGVVSKAR